VVTTAKVTPLTKWSLGWSESESAEGDCTPALPTWSPEVEYDDCEDEDSDASGIADLDGLREVVGGVCAVAYV
jgi:hypothetical protein